MESQEKELRHHGILGMKWGKQNGPPYPLLKSKMSSAEKNAQKSSSQNSSSETSDDKTTKPKSVKDLSDEELDELIRRLDKEKRYKDLLSSANPVNTKTMSEGRKFVMDILKRSGSNIGEQIATYVLGTLANSVAGKEIVNPKKGQKGK